MKRKVMVIIGIIGFLAMYTLASYIDCHYTKEMTVFGKNTLIDSTGNIWKYEHELQKDVKVECKMFTNHTDNFYDDEILEITAKF